MKFSILISAALALSCSASAVQSQAIAADSLATLTNTVVLPELRAAYEREQRQALDRDCPVACSSAVATAAVAPVRARWQPIWHSAQALTLAHDAWRVAVEKCRTEASADSGACSVDLQELARNSYGALEQFRCALRSSGHYSADRYSGQISCGGSDAGQ